MEDLAKVALPTLCLQMPNSEGKKKRGKGQKKKKKNYFSFMIVSVKTCAPFQLSLSVLKSAGASVIFCGPCLKATSTVSNCHGVAVAMPALSSAVPAGCTKHL